ncbi:Protein of unknown function DUF1191 [Macleaya cordata]|uniref:Uncharacterized protein n=1 Tax=Macleaya cordata TaxID=56857 RepID=A0A200Q3Q2_MACCD|nr:Protein of unknown function DUF1191 [Macleaya cordata]
MLSLNNFSQNSLDSLLKDYAFETTIGRPHTGTLFKVALPATLSGIEASVVRLRSGNWSSSYYNLEGYSLVTPIFGFRAYDGTSLTGNEELRLDLNITGYQISIHFPQVIKPTDGSNSRLKCVRYGLNGSTDFSEMTVPNVCFTQAQGHFSIVRSIEQKMGKKKKKQRLWKCWVMKKIAEMEREANEGEVFETFRIGISKMPSAKVIRTKPVFEHREAL